MTVTESTDHAPGRPPTSREINLAIELLKRADADPDALRLLDIWNAHRLVESAQNVGTHEELASLFTGLPGSPGGNFSK